MTGNTLGETKEVMIRNRLEKICREIGDFDDTDELLSKVYEKGLEEVFINAFTTNKTEFFREVFHFEDLINRVFKEHFAENETISMYSCASSSGEEVYSIAIAFQYFKEQMKKLHINANIIASDIDTNMLSKAREGIYKYYKNENTFPEWVIPSRYFQRREIGDENYFLIRAKESLRKYIEFRQLNLIAPRYPFAKNSLDVIFCRNVLIYFSIEDQNEILKKLLSVLKVGGTLYLGHSESPLEITYALKRLGMNTFVKVGEL